MCMIKRKIILMLDSSRAADRGVIKGIVNYSNSRGEWTIYRFSPLFRTYPFSGDSGSDEIWDKLVKFDADGIIGYIPNDNDLLDKIRARNFPAVIQPVITPIHGVVNIRQDSNTGIMGANYLMSLGVKRFGFCGMDYCWSKVRQQAFNETIISAGLENSIAPENASGVSELVRWLMTLEFPAAIMACNDERAYELVEACRIAMLDIPQQVAILGVDDDEMICPLSNVPISSVQMNFETVGYNAAEAVDRMISSKGSNTISDILCSPTAIVKRASTDILEIDDIEVANAIRYIRNNAKRAITVSDVQKNSFLSLRSLQLRFKKVLNRSLYQEIQRERVAEISRQLLNTNLTVQQIAYTMGIEDINHISRLFKKVTGMTPIEYRRKMGYNAGGK